MGGGRVVIRPDNNTRGAGRLAGKRAFITGAAGGLGAAIACQFAADGAVVTLAARRVEPLDALAGAINTGSPDAARVAVLDVTDAGRVATCLAEADAAMGGLDVIVNAAAIDTGWAAAAAMALDIWDDTISTNLSGTYYVCRAAIPLMIGHGGGVIVNVTSVAGHRAWAEDAAYNASKAGVTQLTRTIAVEYATSGIRANCLAPGVIDAGLTDTVTDPAEREQLVGLHPMRRMGHAREVAAAAVFLASDESSFTTGSTLQVDGGFLA
jgi:NAD(P)-dependent dehydrogenase (short-subunit alcohol dehydrogenase family)